MASHCRSSIGRRPAIIIFGIFHSIPTDENGLIEKVEQSIPSLISCGRYMNGVTRSLQTPSRSDPSPPATILTLGQGLRQSLECQERTHAVQQTASLFDRLVGERICGAVVPRCLDECWDRVV